MINNLRSMRGSGRVTGAVIGAALLVGACSETQLALHAAKQLSNADNEIATGHYKVGEPYKIKGVWYYPKVDFSYAKTGVASWYGPKFHKKRTANGQIYDMNAISAAHKTLPLPSVVRVTNLKNGRSIKVLVNDRGPFARGRIIDVSRRTAQLLGFERAGTAPVRVEILPDESRRVALIAQGGTPGKLAPPEPAPVQVAARQRTVQRVTGPAPVRASTDVTVVPISDSGQMYIQAGSFMHRDLAERTQRSLAQIGPTRVVEAQVGDRKFYRVRVGPIATIGYGDQVLDQVVERGFPNAQLVVD